MMPAAIIPFFVAVIISELAPLNEFKISAHSKVLNKLPWGDEETKEFQSSLSLTDIFSIVILFGINWFKCCQKAIVLLIA